MVFAFFAGHPMGVEPIFSEYTILLIGRANELYFLFIPSLKIYTIYTRRDYESALIRLTHNHLLSILTGIKKRVPRRPNS